MSRNTCPPTFITDNRQNVEATECPTMAKLRAECSVYTLDCYSAFQKEGKFDSCYNITEP
jgi:hypothetical protein